MLGYRPIDQPSRAPRSFEPDRSMGLEDPIRYPSRFTMFGVSETCILTYLQWVWPIPLLIVAFLAPESPWWLVRRGRIVEARASLARLTTQREGDDFDIDNTIAMMRHTNQLEMEVCLLLLFACHD